MCVCKTESSSLQGKAEERFPKGNIRKKKRISKDGFGSLSCPISSRHNSTAFVEPKWRQHTKFSGPFSFLHLHFFPLPFFLSLLPSLIASLM